MLFNLKQSLKQTKKNVFIICVQHICDVDITVLITGFIAGL